MDTKEQIIEEYEKVKEVRQSYGEIARKVGVSKTYVYMIIKDYKNIAGEKGVTMNVTKKKKEYG